MFFFGALQRLPMPGEGMNSDTEHRWGGKVLVLNAVSSVTILPWLEYTQ